jgi:cytochrome subunit of sulfide dehydrogenase
MEEYAMAVKQEIRLTVCALFFTVISAGGSMLPADCSASSRPSRQAPVIQSESSPRGQILSLSCASCHGTDGKSVGIIPSINSFSAEYIETALKGFKTGARPSTVMSRHAKGYTDDELKLIAEYFGTVSPNTK